MEQSEAFDVAVVFPKSNSEHTVKRKSSYFIVALECFIRVCSCFVCCRHVPDCLKHLSRVGEKKNEFLLARCSYTDFGCVYRCFKCSG